MSTQDFNAEMDEIFGVTAWQSRFDRMLAHPQAFEAEEIEGLARSIESTIDGEYPEADRSAVRRVAQLRALIA